MKSFFANNKMLLALGLVLMGCLYLTQSYHKKTVSLKQELSIEKEAHNRSIEQYKNEIKTLEIKSEKSLAELKQKNKKTKITYVKNADGSIRKDIEISDLGYTSLNMNDKASTVSTEQVTEANKLNESSSKEVVNVKEEFKSEEIKKSNWGGAGAIAVGVGIVACFATGHCSFSF